jgi:RNA polymerase sigma-70 factor, ECF subfamily
MTDEEIVSHVQRGQTRLFSQIVERHQDAVYGTALRFTGSASDAEDVAQEVFLKAFRGLGSFKGDAKVSTWLYRIAYNLCVDWLRKNRKAGRRASPLDEAGEAADGRVDLEGTVLAAEERDRVRAALDGLDERYRSVIDMLYYQKLSYEQIAVVLGVPLKTVETRLYRARKVLRAALESGGTEGP